MKKVIFLIAMFVFLTNINLVLAQTKNQLKGRIDQLLKENEELKKIENQGTLIIELENEKNELNTKNRELNKKITEAEKKLFTTQDTLIALKNQAKKVVSTTKPKVVVASVQKGQAVIDSKNKTVNYYSSDKDEEFIRDLPSGYTVKELPP